MNYEICKKMDCPYLKKDYVDPDRVFCAKAGCGADEGQGDIPEDCPCFEKMEEI